MRDRELKLAWAAGLIDGEGCISLTRRQPQPGAGSLNPNYRLVLKVTMTCEKTINTLFELFQVGSLHGQQLQKSYYSAARIWFCNATAAQVVLQEVQPYLVTKAEESALALEFLKLPKILTGGAGGNRAMAPDELAAREHYWQRLRDLKPANKAKDRKASEP